MGIKRELKRELLRIYAEVISNKKFTDAHQLRDVLLLNGVSKQVLNNIRSSASFIKVLQSGLDGTSEGSTSKPIPKKEVLKCIPGTWLRLSWNDSKDTPALLIEAPVSGKGDVSLKCFYPDTGDVNSHAVHTQVVAILDDLVVPEVK